MGTDSNYFAFSEDNKFKPHMREKYNFLPHESDGLHPSFKVDNKPFTLREYDTRAPGLFKVETTKDKLVSLC